MNESIIHTLEELEGAGNKQFLNVANYSKLKVAIQKISGEHNFFHTNNNAYEHIIVLKGSLSMWTEKGTLAGNAGDILTIPPNIKHGNITGEDASIIILENFSEDIK